MRRPGGITQGPYYCDNDDTASPYAEVKQSATQPSQPPPSFFSPPPEALFVTSSPNEEVKQSAPRPTRQLPPYFFAPPAEARVLPSRPPPPSQHEAPPPRLPPSFFSPPPEALFLPSGPQPSQEAPPPHPPPPPSTINTADTSSSSSSRPSQKRRRCTMCREQKVVCDGNAPCRRCTKKGFQCVYVSKRDRKARDADSSSTSISTSMRLRAPPHSDRVVNLADQVASAVTRIFREAMESGFLNSKKAASCLAAWKIRQNTVGLDYSHGACDDILSFAGLSINDDVAEQCAQASPAPHRYDFDLDNLVKSWSEIDDGRSCISCMIYKRGHWTILCNDRFQQNFASQEEMDARVHETRTLPSFFYASTVSNDDQAEFAKLIAQTYFMTEGDCRGDYTSVLKCVDRHEASFLAVVRMQFVCFGSGGHVGLMLSILPLPKSQYLKAETDITAPIFRPLPFDPSMLLDPSITSVHITPAVCTRIPQDESTHRYLQQMYPFPFAEAPRPMVGGGGQSQPGGPQMVWRQPPPSGVDDLLSFLLDNPVTITPSTTAATRGEGGMDAEVVTDPFFWRSPS